MKKRRKKSVIKRNKKITIAIGILIGSLLFFVGLYKVVTRYLDNQNNIETDGARPVFYADKEARMDIAIPNKSETKELADVEYKVSLQNKSKNMTVCKYNMYYVWDESIDGYYKTGNQDELYLTGTVNDEIIFEDVQINDYNLGNLKTLLASYSIVNDGGEITNQTWNITANLKARPNQESILGKKFTGKILIEESEVSCQKASYLKDEKILQNNYVCLGTNDEYCPENNLYQIISINEYGIKVIRTKSYGVSSWSTDLLPKVSEAFLKTDASKFRYMIKDYDWPLYDEPNTDIDAKTAYDNEVNAQNKVTSKVGLLSFSDYKSVSFINDYQEYPYMLLSQTGLVATEKGLIYTPKSVGFIYPVLYLNPNVVISRGDGTRANPYFAN